MEEVRKKNSELKGKKLYGSFCWIASDKFESPGKTGLTRATPRQNANMYIAGLKNGTGFKLINILTEIVKLKRGIFSQFI